jgi:starch phosphorylase
VEDPGRYQPIRDSLLSQGDHYMLLADYAGYVATQRKVAELYSDHEEWARRAILNVARMGKFSSDRSIKEYAEQVWDVKAAPAKD